MDVRSDIRTIQDVLSTPRYAALMTVIAVLSFTVYSLLLNVGLLSSLFAAGDYMLLVTMIPLLVSGFIKSTTLFSLFMLAITSLMIGANLSLAIFRLLEMSEFGREGAGSIGGVALATLAPACPACATTIFAVAGLSSLFAVLPFKGTEIKVLAVMFLAGSAVYTARQIDREVCKLCQI